MLLRTLALSSTLLLSACSLLPGKQSLPGVDGMPCVGEVPEKIEGLSSAPADALNGKAVLPSGRGGLCTARRFTSNAALTVYRVYDAERPWNEFGGWWSLSRPLGPRTQYRSSHGVCPEWGKLDRLVSCQLKPGSPVVVGTTQNATCTNDYYAPKTAELQLYVPNDPRTETLYVENCQELGVWPPMFGQ